MCLPFESLPFNEVDDVKTFETEFGLVVFFIDARLLPPSSGELCDHKIVGGIAGGEKVTQFVL